MTALSAFYANSVRENKQKRLSQSLFRGRELQVRDSVHRIVRVPGILAERDRVSIKVGAGLGFVLVHEGVELVLRAGNSARNFVRLGLKLYFEAVL